VVAAGSDGAVRDGEETVATSLRGDTEPLVTVRQSDESGRTVST
jgi:hypothetical protein